jgi:hypothetical protein
MKNLILLLAFSAVPMLAEDITGKWTFNTDFLGNRDTVECIFQQNAANLSGACKSEQFPETSATGTVNEDNIQFSFVYLFAGQSFTCTYKGKATGNAELSGSIVVSGIDGVTGEFKAKKQQEKK